MYLTYYINWTSSIPSSPPEKKKIALKGLKKSFYMSHLNKNHQVKSVLCRNLYWYEIWNKLNFQIIFASKLSDERQLKLAFPRRQLNFSYTVSFRYVRQYRALINMLFAIPSIPATWFHTFNLSNPGQFLIAGREIGRSTYTSLAKYLPL